MSDFSVNFNFYINLHIIIYLILTIFIFITRKYIWNVKNDLRAATCYSVD